MSLHAMSDTELFDLRDKLKQAISRLDEAGVDYSMEEDYLDAVEGVLAERDEALQGTCSCAMCQWADEMERGDQ